MGSDGLNKKEPVALWPVKNDVRQFVARSDGNIQFGQFVRIEDNVL